ncbi:hypothetical protein ACJMK2_033903, partial [Sinanodonta woodiana]
EKLLDGTQAYYGSPNGPRQGSVRIPVESIHERSQMESSSHVEGSTLTAHDINYSVSVKTKTCCGRNVEKRILKNIHACFRPGMNAILGPTGSGKSSLLDVLAGRKNPNGLSGTLLLDGQPLPENFKCMVGYVVQDDVVVGMLTVRENFQFSAALRLPSTVSKTEREKRVEQVIQELGLQHCADTKVGNEFIRGISGGERKRTNIGMELIISPPVLFLDEPTTGLDANTANSVSRILKRLADKGRTIIFSIHQPRYSIYSQFDSLTLLSLGNMVYHGPCAEALDFFKSAGFPCQEHNNPPDFFLDVINGDLGTGDFEHYKEKPNQIEPAKGKYGQNEGMREENQLQNALVAAYHKSHWCQSLMNTVNPIFQNHIEKVKNRTVTRLPPIRYATSFIVQFLYICQRTLRNLIRNPATSIMQIGIMVIFGLIVGAIYWDVDKSCKSGLQNRVGAFFFIVMNQVFGNLSAVELFIKERAIFIHENVSGFYRVSSYFFAIIVCDLIPMRLVPNLIFSVIVYFMIGLKEDAGSFFIFTLALFCVSIAASSLAFFFSALVRIFAIANLLIALCYVFMMVFSGLLVNLDSIGDWLEWIKYISVFRYAINALDINELKDMAFEGNCTTGNQYLVYQGISYSSSWDLWSNYVALGCITFGFMAFAYIRLLTMSKLR